MARTQSELIGDIRAALDDEHAGRFTDRQIRRWINQATKDISRRAECLRTSTTQATTASTAAYTAPVDCIRIHDLQYADADGQEHGSLTYVDKNALQLYGTVTDGWPRVWTSWGYPPTMQYEIYPPPNESSATITVYYYKLATELAEVDQSDAATNIDLPAGWDDLVIEHVEYKALRADRDPRWQEAKALYDGNLTALMEATTRFTDQAGQFGGEWRVGGLWFNEDAYLDMGW